MSAHDDYLDPDRYFEEVLTNEDFKEQFADYESLSRLDRSVYKYTKGVNVYVTVIEGDDAREVYDLDTLGSFADMDANGILITAIHAGGIVEGVDECPETITVKWTPDDVEPSDLHNQFWDAVDAVDDDIDRIWNETHGCEHCGEPTTDDYKPVDPDCNHCLGNGVCM